MNMLARWLFRRIVEPRVIGVIWLGEFNAEPGSIMPPHEVEVLLRGE